MQARTKDGITYTLRFGEVVYGSGEVVSAGGASENDAKAGPGENRYLFITTEFDTKEFVEPAKPANTNFLNTPDSVWTSADKRNKELHEKHEKWQKKVESSQKLSTTVFPRGIMLFHQRVLINCI